MISRFFTSFFIVSRSRSDLSIRFSSGCNKPNISIKVYFLPKTPNFVAVCYVVVFQYWSDFNWAFKVKVTLEEFQFWQIDFSLKDRAGFGKPVLV